MRWDRWVGSLDGRPTMHIKNLIHLGGCRIDLHKMVKADDPECFHTHPAWAVRIVLWGGYVEERYFNGERQSRWSAFFPGRIGIVHPDLCHRIGGLFFSVSYSIWIRFRKCAEIELHGEGWKDDRHR